MSVQFLSNPLNGQIPIPLEDPSQVDNGYQPSIPEEWMNPSQARPVTLGQFHDLVKDALMNPNEALSLGSISQIVMPSDLRQVLAESMAFYLRRYRAEPLQSVQREFH